ncbi:hypothetical protein, partial [Falsigemmobacter intermedius]
MRMIAIHAQTERKRLDRSVRCAEKRRPWARKQRLRGLIRPDPAVCATAGAACGRKSLSSARIQAIFTSNDTPLGECRLKRHATWGMQVQSMQSKKSNVDILNDRFYKGGFLTKWKGRVVSVAPSVGAIAFTFAISVGPVAAQFTMTTNGLDNIGDITNTGDIQTNTLDVVTDAKVGGQTSTNGISNTGDIGTTGNMFVGEDLSVVGQSFLSDTS